MDRPSPACLARSTPGFRPGGRSAARVAGRGLAGALLLALLPSLAGCPPKVAPTPLGIGAADWPFRPATMSFHALTRADSPEAAKAIVVRVEFLDGAGDPVKAIGVLEVEVDCEAATPSERTWTFDLTDRAANERLFDPVTFAYRVRLEEPWTTPPAPGSPVRLRGVLAVGEERITCEALLRW